jgi:radical SAM superfamily enzyme YgiQ (UPF0313 family)
VGYPNEIFNLIPDNGLANLAACLMEKSHKTLIWDCSTVDMVRRLFPHKYKDELQGLIKKIVEASKQGLKPEKEDLESFYSLESRIDEFQRNEIRNIGKEISKYVNEHRIDFVGFKLWTGAGFDGAMIIAEQIKKDNPDIYIFGGGPHIDWFQEMVFNVTGVFDVLAYGEGEETITMLADYVEGKRKLEDIPNLIFKKDNKIITTPSKGIEDLNKIPLPMYDDDVYPAMKDGQKIKVTMIDESRGCPNSCNFCIHSIKSGNKWRMTDAKNLVDKIEKIMDKYKIKTFRFAGSNPPPSLMKEIAQEIIKRKLDIAYSAFSYSKGMSKECYELLKKSGCCGLTFGVESGSQEIIDRSINKKARTDKIKESIHFCKECGMHAIVSIILPAPFETEKTKQETLDFLLDTRPDSTIVCFPGLVRGTEWEKNCKKYGFYIENYKELFETAMTFRVNHMCPPVLWRPLNGFGLNGKSFKEMCNETFDFTKKLRKAGLVTQLIDQIFLISHAMKTDSNEFAKKAYKYVSTGDYVNLGEMVKNINSSILI